MDLYEIRKRNRFAENQQPTVKCSAQIWLNSLASDYQYAATLTVKQSLPVLTDRGQHIRKLKRSDCDAIAHRFKLKLNRQVFGKAAERYQKSVNFLAVVEGERSGKNLHFHVALGNFPKHYRSNEIPALVKNAIIQVRELTHEHDVQIMDSGWMEYITKELGRHDTDNVLWHLV